MSAYEEFRVDMHVKVLDERVVSRAKRRGLDALVYAPHFTRLPTIERRAAAFSDDELLVVPARELFTGDWRNRKHVLAIGLRDPVPDFLTLDGTMAELDRQDAAVLVPHPEFLTVSLDAADIRRYHSLVDAVEVYNPKHWPRHNRRAAAIARDVSVPAFTSSYAHLHGTVGEAWTVFDRADVVPDVQSASPMGSGSSTADRIGDRSTGESIARERSRDRSWTARVNALVTALRSGVERRIARRRDLSHLLRCVAEFAHLGYENSWKKAHRVLRPRLAATHPRHPAYGGRFDDDRAY